MSCRDAPANCTCTQPDHADGQVDGVPHCASCSSDFLEIVSCIGCRFLPKLDDSVNPPSPPPIAANLHYDVEVFEEHGPSGSAEQDPLVGHQHHHHHHNQPAAGHARPGGILSTLLSGIIGAYNAPDDRAGAIGLGAETNPGPRTMTFTLPGGGVGSFMIGRPQRLAPEEREELGLERYG